MKGERERDTGGWECKSTWVSRGAGTFNRKEIGRAKHTHIHIHIHTYVYINTHTCRGLTRPRLVKGGEVIAERPPLRVDACEGVVDHPVAVSRAQVGEDVGGSRCVCM